MIEIDEKSKFGELFNPLELNFNSETETVIYSGCQKHFGKKLRLIISKHTNCFYYFYISASDFPEYGDTIFKYYFNEPKDFGEKILHDDYFFSNFYFQNEARTFIGYISVRDNLFAMCIAKDAISRKKIKRWDAAFLKHLNAGAGVGIGDDEFCRDYVRKMLSYLPEDRKSQFSQFL